MKRETDLTYEIDTNELPSEAMVRAVASFTNTPILDLDPLHDVIDPDHLNGIFDAPKERQEIEERSITLNFNGCQVTVTQERILVREPDANLD
jgi:hypothetical protein